MAEPTTDERLAALERRLALVEAALGGVLTERAEPAGKTRTVFGIEVAVRPEVTEEQIRQAIAALPVGKSGDEVVDELEAQGLLARVKGKGR